jgi:6-pyruvoyl-tetrahydropterin synthase
MRTKTTHTLDTSALTEAWSEFFQEKGPTDIETLNKQGWLSIAQIVEKMNVHRTSVDYMLKKNDFEKKKFNIKINGTIRLCCFYRPKA